MRNETSGEPVYESADRFDPSAPFVCTECGALIPGDYTGTHNRWHWRIWSES